MASLHDLEPVSSLGLAPYSVRFALYEDPLSPPRIEVLQQKVLSSFLKEMVSRACELAQSMGSLLPSLVVKELLDNLIHSGFRDPVLSLQNGGNTITVSDRGPGIESIEKAMGVGYTTATESMREIIRGVGSGLPLVQELMQKMGGLLTIESNLSGGTVVRASLNGSVVRAVPTDLLPGKLQRALSFDTSLVTANRLPNIIGLTDREKHVLLLLAESETAGPSKVAKELDISLSTAHRDLAKLERHSLVRSLPNGKKKLTEEGLGQLEFIFSNADPLRAGKSPQSSPG